MEPRSTPRGRDGHRIDTLLVHAGRPDPRIAGAVATPIFQSVTFEYGGQTDYHEIRYARLNNTPNHEELHARLAALEGAEAGLVAASGMAAISTTLLTLLGAGDHLLAQDCLYGGTHDLVTRDLPALDIACDFVPGDDSAAWERHLRPTTKVFYLETLSNPRLGVPDVRAAVDFARAHDLVTVIDNTFASPVHFRPAQWGIDLSLHSATKYLNGHSDVVAGAVVGRADLVAAVRRKLNHLGGTLDPHACFLLARGMKTLAVRMRHQTASALAVARFLEEHPAVARVDYPGLESHPQHALARKLLDGPSAMLSFEPRGGAAAARRVLERVTLPISAPSLGGVESLITLPATTSHVGMVAADRERLGITDSLVRLSVGLEAAEDLIEDLDRALAE